jgi:amidase
MLAFKSATELVQMLRDRQLSARELLTEYRTRADRYNAKLNAIIWSDPSAETTARTADAGSLLAGLPMTVKESFDVTGAPTTWGIPELRNNIASTDSVVVERMRAAGANVFGKTNVPLNLGDFQSYNVIYGTTNNPWDTHRTPGGSSGGSAAALAAGLTALEIGSDIGGSIRNPAHFCGVFGHKPTYRLIPARGHAPPGVLAEPEIAVVGPLARTAADLDLALDVLALPDRLETGLRYDLPRLDGRTLKDLKVALWANDDLAPVSRDVERGVERVADVLRRADASVNADARPAFSAQNSNATYSDLLFAYLSIAVPDPAFAELKAQTLNLAPDDQRPEFAMARAQTMDHRRWIQMNEAREKLRWAWRNFFDQYDVLIAPIMATAAFPHDQGPMGTRTIDVDGSPRPYFEQVFWAGLPGVAYLPATVIPTGNNAAGLPIGVQIIGPAYGDRITIGVARLLEAEGFAFTPPPAYV